MVPLEILETLVGYIIIDPLCGIYRRGVMDIDIGHWIVYELTKPPWVLSSYSLHFMCIVHILCGIIGFDVISIFVYVFSYLLVLYLYTCLSFLEISGYM